MKKFIIFIFTLVFVLSMSGCASLRDDPIKLARKLIDKDYQIVICLEGNNEDIFDSLSELFDCSISGVYCCMSVMANDSKGVDEMTFIMYCDTNKEAKRLEKQLEDYMKDHDKVYKRSTVKRVVKVCYVGCGDALDDLNL